MQKVKLYSTNLEEIYYFMKGKKYIVPVMLASLVGAPVAVINGAVMSSANAYDSSNNLSVVGPEITLAGYKAKYKKGESIEVPTVQGLGVDFKQEVKVVDPLGNEYDVEGNTYAATYAGTYKFKYSLYRVSGETKQSIDTNLFEEVSIFVEGDDYTIESLTNSYHVVPSEMKYTANRVVTFPVPKVLKNDDLQNLTDGTLQVVITKTGSNDEIILKSSDTNQYVAKDASNNTTGEAYFTHTFTSAGRYRYKYQYVVGTEVVATTEAKTFRLSENTTVEDVELNFSTLSDISTTGGEVGKAIDLPQVKVFEKGNTSKTYEAYTKIVVTYLGSESVTNRVMELEEDGFSFIPKYTGNYQVEYNISIPNMNGLSVKNAKKYIIEDVSDTTSPDVYLTNSYNIGEDGKVTTLDGSVDLTDMEVKDAVSAIGDRSYAVNSYYRLSDADPSEVTVEIPAAYVNDNHASIKDIKVTRVLYKKGNSSNTFTLVKQDGENEEKDATKVAYYTFKKDANGAGDYVVRYTVEDDSTTGNSKTYSYYIHIVESSKLDTAWIPQITIDASDNLPSSIEADDLENITFNKPSVVDKHNGNIYDENLDVHTYIAYSDTQIATAKDVYELNSKVELKANDKDQFEIDFSENAPLSTSKYLYVVSTAKNSYNNTLAYEFKEIKINRPSQEGDNAPKFQLGVKDNLTDFTASGFNSALIDRNKQEDGVLDSTGTYALSDNGLTTEYKGLFNQGDKVILPAMTFNDENDDMTVSVYVTYLSNDGKVNKIDVTSYDRTNWVSGNTHYSTISNASFVADYAKMYTVTYVARDVNNYFTCRSFGVYINDTVAPVIKVKNNSKFAENVEVGTWFKVPTAYVEDNGEVDDTIKTSWRVVSSSGTPQTKPDSFRPMNTGTYYVIYSAVDAAGNPSETSEKQYSITVVATKDPKISLVTTNYDEELDWDYTNKFVYFAVPKAQAEDSLGSVTVGTPVVKDGNSQTVDMVEFGDIPTEMQNKYTESDYYFYKATSQGKYTVTYTAKNSFGREATTTINIEVGDCVAPIISWVNKDEDFKASVNEGDIWQFKMSMVNIEDNLDETIASDNITITMTDPDGKVVENGDDYKYTFDKVGNYTFKIKAKDTAGNDTYNTYSYTITVKAKDANTDNKNTVLGMSPALGTTLIVLSVVVLGGVIVYFVLSSNKAKKVANKNNKSKK